MKKRTIIYLYLIFFQIIICERTQCDLNANNDDEEEYNKDDDYDLKKKKFGRNSTKIHK